MFKHRLFNLGIATALVVMAVLVINQTAATAKVVSSVSNQSTAAACPFSAEDLKSLRAEYQPEIGVWLPKTDKGYTGQEGGMLALLTCPAQPGSKESGRSPAGMGDLHRFEDRMETFSSTVSGPRAP